MAFMLLASTLIALVSAAPCASAEFSLAMQVGGESRILLSLSAIESGRDDGELYVVADRLAPYFQGTPVAANGTSGNTTLDFVVDENTSSCNALEHGTYGISVADLGELYGHSVPVTAAKDREWPHFFVGQGDVEPQRTAASQQWYACNVTVQGAEYLGLSWGVYNSNGSSPYGCFPTSLHQVFNIPCKSSHEAEAL